MAGCDSGCGEGHAPGGGGHPFWPPPVPAPELNPWRRPVSWLAVGMIKCYQNSLSRLWPNVCKYHPSCSNYAIHAIVKRGLVVGCLMGGWRILRCNPFARGGYDPPPGYEDVLRELSRDAGA